MNHTLTPPPNRRETAWGFAYMALQLTVLPIVLQWGNGLLNSPLSAGELNLVFFLVNYLTVLWIFHSFLSRNLAAAQRHPVQLLQTVILALAGYYACTIAYGVLVSLLYPSFFNQNDAAIAALGQDSFFLLTLGTVVLVPTVEECFFRGLIFRNLWCRSRTGAYVISTLAFSALHVLGYLGSYTTLELVIAGLQYLPAGAWLAWSYQKSGTIAAPILTHAAVNAISMAQLL